MDYFDVNLGLSWEDIALRDAARKFATEVMRPASKALDRMPAEDAVGPGSPIWGFLRKAYELNYHKALMPAAAGGLGLTPLQMHLVQEELAWGSFGLSALLASAGFAFQFAGMTGDEELIDRFAKPYATCTDASLIGCWAATEPDHGSDVLADSESFFTSPEIRCNARATRDGDEWVINGQKSAWVSGAPIATHALVHLQTDSSRGLAGWGMCIVPMKCKGVSRGKPLRKIGQRDLCQGEIFFDDVRIPIKWMLLGPDAYVATLRMILSHANAMMATWSTGLARASFEEALQYAKDRVQGGKPIIEHYSMRQRLLNMFAKVEACRALSRAVMEMNFSIDTPFLEYSVAAKVSCTQMCFDNAHEAIQILGGNGLTEEYLAEKLFRDARATLIMDGNNESLAASAGAILAKTYPRGRTQVGSERG